MQPSGAAGDELLWHALREREPYRRIREPLAPIDPAIVTAMHHVRPQLPRIRELAALHAAQAGNGSPQPLWWRALIAHG